MRLSHICCSLLLLLGCNSTRNGAPLGPAAPSTGPSTRAADAGSESNPDAGAGQRGEPLAPSNPEDLSRDQRAPRGPFAPGKGQEPDEKGLPPPAAIPPEEAPPEMLK